MSSTCSNCKVTLSCGCQKRVASDGKPVCSACLAAYEKQIKSNNAPKPSSGTAPTNVNVFYKAP